MENHIQHIEFINQYLNKSLSAKESEIFLNQLKTDSYFKNLYEEHLVFLEGLKRQTLKAEIKTAKQYYTKVTWFKYLGISAVIVVSILAYMFLFGDATVEPKPIPDKNTTIILDSIPSKDASEKKVILKDTLSSIEKVKIEETIVSSKKEKLNLESLKKAPQTFVVDSKKDTTIVCKEGTKLVIKANSFVDANNRKFDGKINFAVTEYYKLSDMLLANLSTTSNDKQLETGGMLFIEAKKNNENLNLAENSSIDIMFPTQNKKENMQLFSGKWKDGIMNWDLQPNQVKISKEPIVETIEVEENEERFEVPFAVIQQPPVYPGCENLSKTESIKCTREAISNFVQNNLNTSIAGAVGLKGRQSITSLFKINKEGNIVSIESRASHPVLQAEADRVISLLPKMKPGIQRGQEVTVRYSLPIIFKVDGSSGRTSIDNNIQISAIPVDSIITQNFENSLVKESSTRSMSTNVNSYILRTLNLGWINCDRFINGRTQRIKYSLRDNEGNKALVSMIFKSINSVLPSRNINGIYNFGTVGNNEDIVLIAIKKDNGKLYFDAVETKTQPNPDIQFNFKEVSIEELKNELNKINKLFQ
ncbi:MAG: energy transducer TonB [Flavobacteriales bacterium]